MEILQKKKEMLILDSIQRTKDGYRLKQTINGHASYFFLTTNEAIELSQRFDRDFEQDARDEEEAYEEVMKSRAKAMGL